ncbi:isochorismatase domain-containing protein 2 isoform X1 [Pseudorca crassidens]|uniref:isochorismatase domain-containing protein 2 isoform X1 n=1 Tax=Pseudorca crassidens TaxID=82174 RepID=UPI00352C3E6B
MAAVRPGLGRIIPGSSILFLCDMQEKFRHVSFFPQIVSVAARMLKVAQLLDVPVVLTEQYPQGLGPTVPELGAESLQPWSKTCFSMVPAVQQELDARPQLRSVLLCGLETQACILPLPLSAPSTQPWTSWTKGCRSTWWWTPAPPADPEDHQGARPRQRAAGPLPWPEPPLPLNSLPCLEGRPTTFSSLGPWKRCPPHSWIPRVVQSTGGTAPSAGDVGAAFPLDGSSRKCK